METTLNTQKEDVEIDLREILFLLLDRLLIILLVGALAAGLAFLGTKLFITPKYQSETSIYVMNKNEEATVNSSDYVTSNYMTQDYTVLITSRTVMEQVIADLDLGDELTASQLVGMISVENQENTRIINITITDTNPVRAMDLANAVRIASAAKITEVMGIEDVNVVEEANLNATPVSPNVFKNMIIGAMLGMVLTIAVIIIRHITDDTIKSPDEIEKYLGISTLASIPVMLEEEWDGEKKGSKKSKKNSKTRSSSGRTRTAASSKTSANRR
jgi:capsular polysaccharide biosynthesis protein